MSLEIKPGQSVMDLAKENKLPVSSSCNGMCACAECRVYIVKGEAHILPPSSREVELIGGGYFIDNRRLSCQLFCFGDVTVDLSEQVERHKQGGAVKKQLLKQLSKDKTEGSSSVGGILVEQDQEINKIQVPETDEKKTREKKRKTGSGKNRKFHYGRKRRHSFKKNQKVTEK